MIVHNEQAIIEETRKYPRTYIYGAGYVGGLLNKRFYANGINIDGFCVSDEHHIKNDAHSTLKQIGHDDVLVIVAAKEHLRAEFERNLEALGFQNYLTVSDKLILTMERIEERRLRFQTHLVEHCNLNCRGCYHFSSLAEEEYLDPNEFTKDLDRLSELFNGEMDEILLLGGEPLLHPRISCFPGIARRCFPSGTIKILTNGTRLLNIEDDFFEQIKDNDVELWVTKYPISFSYEDAEKRANSFGVEINYFNQEPVRSLGHQPLDISGCQDYKVNFYNCYRANECVDLKHGKIYPCILPAEIKPFQERFGTDIKVCSDDYIDIYEVGNADELLSKLEKPIPFCRFCNRNDVNVFGCIPWSTTNYEMSEWTQ